MYASTTFLPLILCGWSLYKVKPLTAGQSMKKKLKWKQRNGGPDIDKVTQRHIKGN